MENGKKEIAEFYKQIFSDIKLKEKIVEKAKAIANEEDLKKLIQQEIVPLMKKFNVNFSEEELLSYEQETLKKLSEEALESVSGGVSIKSALLTGGLLSMALLGGVGLNSSIASAMDNEPPSPPGEERRVKSSNNAKSRSTQNSNLQQFNNILSPLRENLDEVQQKALDKAMSEHGHVGTDGKNIFIYEKTARPNAVILSRILTPNNDNDTVLEIPESMVTPRGKVDAVGLGEWFLLDSKSLGANVSKFKKITLNPNISKFEFGRFSAAGTESGVNIEEINFGNAKQIEIGENAFSYLQSLKSAIFSNDVEKIILGKHAFLGSHNFETFNLPHCNYMIIESEIFGDSKIKEINIEANELKVKDLDVPYNYKGIHYDAYENFDNTKTLKDNNDDSSSDNNGNSHIDDIDNNNNDNIENDDNDNDNANDNNNNENDNDNANDNNNTDNAQQNDIKNGVKSYLERAENQNLENQNLIDESRENDYEQAKNENRIAIGGGHIFSYTLASSGNGVILTDIYTKVVDGILVIPPEVTTQDGHVRPVVGIRGEKFRTSKIKVVKLGPLTEIFFFEGDAESAFFGNKNIEKVDCSEAAKLKYLEIGDSAFEDSSLKSIVAPPQEVKIVTGKDAYGSPENTTGGKLIKKETLAPIAKYDIYSELSKPSGFFGFFKKASNTIIDKANHVLNKLKSIINLACISKSYMGAFVTDLNSVTEAIKNNETNSLEQSDCELLLNVDSLLENEDYDSQINVLPNGDSDDDNNNNKDSSDHDNDNDNDSGFGGHDNNNNDDGGFNDHSGNNNQGPEEFVASNGNSEASEQQSDNESQKIQAEARMESDIGLKNADNDNSQEPEVAAMPEESNNNAPSSNNKAAQPKETKEKAKDSATKTENSFSWKLTDDGILNISGSGPMPEFDDDQRESLWYPRNEIIKEINISEGITEISAYAFYDCENLDKVSLPGSLKIVGPRAFNGCVNLVNINLPQSLKEIKYSAFENCKSLTNVKLPGKLVSLENSAFKYCAGLTKISIPASVMSFGDYAFYNCDNLTEVALNSDAAVASFQGGFKNCDQINKIILGKDVTSFDINNLVNFKNLKEFAVAEENEKFEAVDGMLVFKDEQDLTLACCPQGKIGHITVPGNVTKIGRLAFYGCSQLTEVTLENGVKEIEQNAFKGCAKNLSINIPVSLISIENRMMDLYFNLQFNSNEEIDKFYENEDDFDKVAPFVKKITLGKDVKYIEDDIFADFSYLQAIEVDSNNQDYTSVDGVLYSKDGQTIERYPMAKPDEVFFVPMGVTKIEASAFAGSKNLRAVPMPPTVIEIGAKAFAGSGIGSVSIPRAVRKISDGTFEGCKGLGHVHLPEGLQVIGNNAFNGCKALVKYGISGKRGINFPKSLKAIGKDAFKGCAQINTNAIPDLPTTYVEEDIVDDVEEKEAAPISTANIDDDDDSTTNNVKKESKKDKNSKKTRVKQRGRGRGRGGRNGSTPTRGGTRKNIKANKSGGIDDDINLNKNEEDEDIADNNDEKSSKEEKSSNKKRKLIKKKPGKSLTAKKTDKNKVEKNKAEETIDDSDDDDSFDDEEEVQDNKSSMINQRNAQKEAQSDKNAKKHNISGTDVFWQFYKETGDLIFSGSGIIDFERGTCAFKDGKRPWHTGYDIKKIIIQEGITGIADGKGEVGGGMFTKCCPNLKEVEIANSVTKIGLAAFWGCTELKTVKLGTGVTEIGEHTFSNCTSLKSINIPSSVQTIGDSAFFNCCDEMESIEIPSSVKTIGNRAFKQCHSLSYVTFSGDNHQLKTIPKEMFNDCSALSAIVLPPSVQKIEDGAFPDNVKIIKMPQ